VAYQYLLIQHLKVPSAEHSQIESRLQSFASDVKQVFMTANKAEGGVVTFLFKTDLPLSEMSFGPLLPGDRLLVVEVTGRHRESGLNVAAHWFQKHWER
jgi:hypothetical protein